MAYASGVRDPIGEEWFGSFPGYVAATLYGSARFPEQFLINNAAIVLGSSMIAYLVGGLLILFVIWGGVYHFKL